MGLPAPKFYDDLPKKWKNVIDQTLHTIIGFALGLADGALSAVILYGYEFFFQWPVERPEDTRQDMGFWLGGTVIGVVVRRILF